MKSFTNMIFDLGVSGHEAVHVVVDLLEYEASVHEGEAALSEKETNTRLKSESLCLFFTY